MAYLKTDERTEAVKGLEFVVRALKMTRKDRYYWKWVIIGLHNTIQEFVVCAISGTAGIGALKKNIAIKKLKNIKSGSSEYVKAELENFLDLYNKMKKKLNFPSTSEIDKSIKRLNDFRNQFIHFTPQGWSLQIDGLPKITEDCLGIVKFLGWEPGHIHWYEENMKNQSVRLYKKAMEVITSVNKNHD